MIINIKDPNWNTNLPPDAPVFVRNYKRSGKTALCRKPSCSIGQVTQFFLNGGFYSEPSTNSQRTVSEQ